MEKIPPKTRDFLGLVELSDGFRYWDIFFWATKENGVRKAGYVDKELYDMPNIVKWQDLPPTEEE